MPIPVTGPTQTYDFEGGLKLKLAHNDHVGSIEQIRPGEGEKLYIPLDKHIGNPSRPVVEVGQRVKKYELLAEPQGHVSVSQHAPTSGIIDFVPDPSSAVLGTGDNGAQEIVLICDGMEETIDPPKSIELPRDDLSGEAALFPDSLKQKLYRRISEAGIIGMGGAGFPSHVKLNEGMQAEVAECIINGVECDPLSCGDSALMDEQPRELISAAVLIGRLLNATRTVLAVSSRTNVERFYEIARSSGIELIVAPDRYPAGSEKQLIKIVTGKELPLNNLPIHIGVVCFNVATAIAMLKAATLARPLVSRVLTINGLAKTVADVPLGLPICRLIELLDGVLPHPNQVTTGGMMMSRLVSDRNAPVQKTTNEISRKILRQSADKRPRACVRCGECINVCPMKLQPQNLFQFSQQSDLDDLQDHGLFDCIECGCCDYVCPSAIPLVEHFRCSKNEINSLAEATVKRTMLLQRYESHLSRQDNATPAERNAALADTDELTIETIDDELAKLKARLGKSPNVDQ